MSQVFFSLGIRVDLIAKGVLYMYVYVFVLCMYMYMYVYTKYVYNATQRKIWFISSQKGVLLQYVVARVMIKFAVAAVAV